MTQTSHKTDAQLKDAVTRELEWIPSVNETHIGVSVDHGAATISGEVGSYPEKRLAEKAVLRVRGISAVANEVTVRSALWGDVNDSDIAREASEALARAVDVPDGSVKAAVHDKYITLSGPVTWQYQREAAERAVRYLKGVTGVFNTVTLRPELSPVGVEAAIGAALVRNAQLESHNITVTHDGGDVTLHGTVHSWSERRQADNAAWSAPGVTGVTNHLRIVVS